MGLDNKMTFSWHTLRWTIKARVTQKSNIRTWSNSRGEGKLFSINLLDDSGEIKATAFRDEVDRYYEMIEVNKVCKEIILCIYSADVFV